MPPKGHRRANSSTTIPKQKKAAPAASKAADEERQDPLQALVLTDSFEPRFRPFTLETPRCLLPLANTPLLAYTLHFLLASGVDEVLLCIGEEHGAAIEAWLSAEGWAARFSRFDVFRRAASSVGDVMREVDQKGVLKGDFLVVHGDVVASFDLAPVLTAHRARKAKDNNAIMTMVLRDAGEGFHRLKPSALGVGQPVFVINPSADRCLHYQEILPDSNERIRLDPELLKEHASLEMRADLIDAGIDICTPDALALWTDSFDYQQPRREYLVGVLRDYELNGKTIHTHVITGSSYAARAHSLQAYHAVTRDVVQRWTFPYCPDANFGVNDDVTLGRGLVYKEADVVLARSAVLSKGSVVGKGASIGEGSVVSGSIVGRGCQIGRNVQLHGAFLWDHVTVGDNAKVGAAIIASEAVVGRGCEIKDGALVSYGVRIADNVIVENTARIVRGSGKPDEGLVGKGGEGIAFVEDEDEDELVDIFRSSNLLYNLPASDSVSSVSSFSSSILSDDDTPHPRRASRGSFGTLFSDDGAESTGYSSLAPGGIVSNDFHYDAATSVFDSLQKGDSTDVVQLELVGLRMSNNASESAVRRAIAAAFAKHLSARVESGATSLSEAVQKVFTTYAQIVKRSMFDYERKGDKRPDQVDFLLALQRELADRSRGREILAVAAQRMYEEELIEEEGFEGWWTDERSAKEGKMAEVRALTERFMTWLRTADEESEEESD